MGTVVLKSLKEFEARFRRDTKKLEARLDQARSRTAKQLVPYVRAHVPVGATSELRDSLTSSGSVVRADAPHAAAVERGSRPHMPPIEPLIAWVKLQMSRGLLSERQLQKLTGTTSAEHAVSVNAMSADYVIARSKRGNALALSIDAPKRIAWAIAMAIKKNGTKPSWFMRSSIPFAEMLLRSNVADALKGKEG